MHFLGKKVPIFKEPAIAGDGPFETECLLNSFVEKKNVVFLFYTKDLTFPWPTKLLPFQQHVPQSIQANVALVGLRYRPISNPSCLVLSIKSKKKYYQRNDLLIEDTSKTIVANYKVQRDHLIHTPMPLRLGSISNYLILSSRS
ncbi:redoxin domain-containing protein [Candidatus Cardinium hertigii]|uniref:redoxin domain-containing protein n=1 Tax=Candidatus Cardinium hertigii TaxID=247481 RepID=UPI003D7E4AD2